MLKIRRRPFRTPEARRVAFLAFLATVTVPGCADEASQVRGAGTGQDLVPVVQDDLENVFGEWQSVTEVRGDITVIRTISGSVWGDTMVLVPETTIGMRDGDPNYVFGDVSQLHPMPDGSVWVADARGPRILVYDSSGTYLRDVGRSGQAPGEFMSVAGIDLTPAGEVAVWDVRNARLSLFEPDGNYVRSIDATSNQIGENLRVDRSGRFWIHVRRYNPSCLMSIRLRDGRVQQLRPETPGCVAPGYVRVSPGEEPGSVEVDSVSVPLPTPTEFVPGFGLGLPEGTVRPFPAEWSHAVSPLGYMVTAYSMAYVVRLHMGPGTESIHIWRDYVPVRIQEEERAEWEAWPDHFARLDPYDRSGSIEIPDAKPALREVWIDDDGRIWVWRYAPAVKRPDAPRIGSRDNPGLTWRELGTHDVFESTGTFLGTVPSPPDTRVRWSSGDVAWGVAQGPLGEDLVVRYRLTRR